ncbi:MAG: hypothetical protein M3328_07820 [Chloroflexota bacterium]|nr:hypothetical protein [Chloroflexota bacterium]
MRSSSHDTFHAKDSALSISSPLLGSTVSVGSGHYVSMLIRDGLEEGSRGQEAAFSEEASFVMVSNPEFLREGSIVCDSLFLEEAMETSTNRTSLWLRSYILWSSQASLEPARLR